MKNLSEKAENVLEYLWNHNSEGIPPTVREICTDLKIKSTSTVHKYLGELEQKGYIIRKGEKLNRAIRLAGNDKIFTIPVYDAVPGKNSEKRTVDYVTFDGQGSVEDYLALKTSDTGMTSAGFFNGDILVIQKGSMPINGNFVALNINNHPVVRRFFEEDGNIRLEPCHKDENGKIIIGKIIMQIRRF